MSYIYNLKLQGHAKDDKPALRFVLNAVDENEALAAALNVKAAFLAVSSLLVRGESITNVITPESDLRPSDPSADGFEEAKISVYLDDTGDKLHTLRIPGGENTLYLPDGQTVNISNAQLVAYISMLEQYIQVSDGEFIDTTITNGIKEGWKASVAKSFKS
jgi:hypothetical protein